jgi:hypothetical protein
MLDVVARLVIALSVAIANLGVAAGGLATAEQHASPGGSPTAIAVIEALAARITSSVEQAEAAVDHATGLDRATEVANEHAADALARATAAKAAGQAKAAAAKASAGGAAEPPVSVPVASGPPAGHPPLPAPPVGSPGQGNRP